MRRCTTVRARTAQLTAAGEPKIDDDAAMVITNYIRGEKRKIQLHPGESGRHNYVATVTTSVIGMGNWESFLLSAATSSHSIATPKYAQDFDFEMPNVSSGCPKEFLPRKRNGRDRLEADTETC